MPVCLLLFQPRGTDWAPLRAALAAAVPEDWSVQGVASARTLLDRLGDPARTCVVLVPDQPRDGQPAGLKLIARIHETADDIPVVVVAEAGGVDRAARAIEAGACDFLVLGDNLPQRLATMLAKVRRLLGVIHRNRLLHEHNAELRDTLQARLKIVGRSPKFRQLLDHIQRVASVPRPVLIVGERGTGKELVARAVHLAAFPTPRPMVTVNCAAFNDALLESELFGYERGAFTGAEATRFGKFEQADGGTLFLDEVGNMSLPFQEKILRVVEYGTFTRVGGTTELRSTARVIAASNRDLRRQIAEGKFLPDLYDRLAFETIQLPPLRERKSDIPVLAQYFLDQFAKETPAFAGKRLSRAALKALVHYAFPGNIRELKNIIERAACHDTGEEIQPEDLGLSATSDAAVQPGTFHEKMHAFARRLVHEALEQAHGNQAQAARALGLPYHQFRYYLRRYGPRK